MRFSGRAAGHETGNGIFGIDSSVDKLNKEQRSRLQSFA
jgi:hypothetical protein